MRARSAATDAAPVAYTSGANPSVTVAGRHFDYPSHVVAPTVDQQGVFDAFMAPRLAHFLAGSNVNVMAYGQTGSGKTHTVFGPPGIMARAASGALEPVDLRGRVQHEFVPGGREAALLGGELDEASESELSARRRPGHLHVVVDRDDEAVGELVAHGGEDGL